MQVSVTREIAGRPLTFETGRIAKQSAGAVMIRYGDSMVLSATDSKKLDRPMDFFPMTVDYRERYTAAGKFAGGFMKREGRPSTRETLTMRLTDRPLRPMFPEGMGIDVQIMSTVFSFDRENDTDVLSINSASAATLLSGNPFHGPVSAVRVGMIDGKLKVNPLLSEMPRTTLNLTVAGTKDFICMVEASASELSEATMLEALNMAHDAIKGICDMQLELLQKSG
jgi:polyribonucleotide nucleotidyltransferase